VNRSELEKENVVGSTYIESLDRPDYINSQCCPWILLVSGRMSSPLAYSALILVFWEMLSCWLQHHASGRPSLQSSILRVYQNWGDPNNAVSIVRSSRGGR